MNRKPAPQPAPPNANEAPAEGVSARRNQKEHRQFPEHEGLVNRKFHKAAPALDSVEGETMKETRIASRRGRTA